MSQERATQTVAEVAERFGVSEWTLRQAVHAGTSPVPPIRVGRRVVFARAAVDRLLEQGDPPLGPEGTVS